MNKKKSNKSFKILKDTLRGKIIDLLEESREVFNHLQVSHRLGIQDLDTRNLVLEIMMGLEREGMLELISQGKFRMKNRKYLTGTLEFTASGTAYLVSKDREDDVMIERGHTGTAIHGDNVEVQLLKKRKSGKDKGMVVSVLSRAKTEFVGTFFSSRDHTYFKCDNAKYPEFNIPRNRTGKAIHGDKALVRLLSWDENMRKPLGEVIEVLGEAGTKDTEMHAILAEYGLPLRFNENIENEAKKIPSGISDDDLKSRRDFRETLTFTIDPADAKDFDDALSIRSLNNGNWEIGVHIADVSHFVREGNTLDTEARNRATSVYLVDRVVPMLPERLSNGICSLVPKEDRFCFSTVFEMNEKAEVLKQWVGKTVIHSNRRFAYEEVQEILETGKGEFAQELLTLDRLAKTLRGKRVQKGSIGFDSIEVKFHLNAAGEPIGVYLKKLADANRLIEDFMLLANITVAEMIGKTKHHHGTRPFVYRVHPPPKEEKLQDFARFVSRFGISFKARTSSAAAAEFNKLMDRVAGTEMENIIENQAVRTMEKAYYTVNNIGHYGLAFEYYTHFTSPIRRYPDLLVHRLLYKYLRSGGGTEKDGLEATCKHCSSMEKKAQQAEWDSIKYMQIQFLKNRVGQEFEGIISGVTEYGMFIELVESKCEGMIRLRALTDDFYYYDAKTNSINGLRKRKKYHLGDKVTVRITHADELKRQLDLEMI